MNDDRTRHLGSNDGSAVVNVYIRAKRTERALKINGNGKFVCLYVCLCVVLCGLCAIYIVVENGKFRLV